MTTLSSFASSLLQLDVGQKSTFPYPPASLNAADLPALWVELPSSDASVISFSGVGWPTLRMRVVVAVVPVAQDRPDANFGEAIAMCDELGTSLMQADAAQSRLSASIRVGIVDVAGSAFWAAIADVEGRG